MHTPASIEDIASLAEKLRSEFAGPIELPEFSTSLGLKSRVGQPDRQFKHLHQMCTCHAEHLALSGRIKLLALLDGYISSVKAKAVIGHYLYARTILEQCAFTNELNFRLQSICAKSESNWMPKGEEFFALLIRFRFATSDKDLQKKFEANGYSQKLLKPVSVMNCIASLSSISELACLVPEYDKLCDHVHHNSPSHFTTSSGFRMGSAANHFKSGGMILTTTPTPITRYEYPTPTKAEKAITDTIASVALSASTCARLLEVFPRSPFQIQQVKQMTGSESGVVYLGQAAPRH